MYIFCYFHGNAVYFTYEKRDERCFETNILWPEVQPWYTWPCQIQAICPLGGEKPRRGKPPEVGVGKSPMGGKTQNQNIAGVWRLYSVLYVYTRIYRMYNYRFCSSWSFQYWIFLHVSPFCLHFFQRQDARGFLSKHRRTWIWRMCPTGQILKTRTRKEPHLDMKRFSDMKTWKTLGFPGPETLALRSENLPSFYTWLSRCDEKALVDEREAHFTWALVLKIPTKTMAF